MKAALLASIVLASAPCLRAQEKQKTDPKQEQKSEQKKPTPKTESKPAKESANKPEQDTKQDGPVVVRPKGRRTDKTPRSLAVRRGLDWLVRAQKPSGRFESPKRVHDIGVTGLAMLAMLANKQETRHKNAIARGVAWLVKQAHDNGQIGNQTSHSYMYGHAIATWALVEAYGRTRSKELKPVIERALRFIAKARNPYKAWRYMPRAGDNDSSVTGWMLLALTAARDFEFQVKPTELTFGLSFLKEVTDPATGKVGYTKRGEGSSRPVNKAQTFPGNLGESLTALSITARLRVDPVEAKDGALLAGADLLLQSPPEWKPDRIDYYYWLHGSHATARLGGRHFAEWRKRMLPTLLQHQSKDPEEAGSWDPVGVWCDEGGRVYSTSAAVLSLTMLGRRSRLIR